jgi:hypothetical protein
MRRLHETHKNEIEMMIAMSLHKDMIMRVGMACIKNVSS